MGDKLLSYGNDYEYSNDYFVLNNIMGDVRIYYKMPICQRATILHTEECKGNYCSGRGYKPDGAMGTSTITYGKLGNQGVLALGMLLIVMLMVMVFMMLIRRDFIMLRIWIIIVMLEFLFIIIM